MERQQNDILLKNGWKNGKKILNENKGSTGFDGV